MPVLDCVVDVQNRGSRAAARGRRGAWSPPSSAASPGQPHGRPLSPPSGPAAAAPPGRRGSDAQLPAEGGGGSTPGCGVAGEAPSGPAGGGRVQSPPAPKRGVLAALRGPR